jgi:hypothetical protein
MTRAPVAVCATTVAVAAALRETDLADWGTAPATCSAAGAGGRPLDVDAAVGDHVHVFVVLALVAEHVTGLEAYFSAGRLQQFQIVSHFSPPLHAPSFPRRSWVQPYSCRLPHDVMAITKTRFPLEPHGELRRVTDRRVPRLTDIAGGGFPPIQVATRLSGMRHHRTRRIRWQRRRPLRPSIG